ncbi:MAG: metalloregulator ArsR/SmtB family transcription factor [Balneolaceae bacterium]|nr:metalloregulator ArsR/SmtB family transcription factor [Balneolaceae bacterium]MDR9410582.1 metalloregulator ArsR/SmtB family transcription factor [Balneolaceae bacterium]
MAITKAELFDKKQVQTAEFAKALGHPARIAILEILSKRDTCICGDITEQLPLAQSTVSQHLKALKSAGIIKGEIDGVRTCYCLDEETISDLQEIMNNFLTNLSTQHSNCC